MKTVYQVQSKHKGSTEWLDDHLPFDSLKEAVEYIKTQPKCLDYQIISWDEFETEEEEQDFHDAWNAIIGDFESCLKLEDYTTEELKAELKRRVEEKKAQKAEEMKNALRCRNCKYCEGSPISSWSKAYKCMARTWGKKYPRHYTVSLSKKACEKFERK